MDSDPLDNLLDKVRDEKSFLIFLEALASDKIAEDMKPSIPYSAGAHGWEHGDIGSYLEAAARCAADGGKMLDAPMNAWQRAAEILYGGKFYE